jgi:hypothetical protein
MKKFIKGRIYSGEYYGDTYFVKFAENSTPNSTKILGSYIRAKKLTKEHIFNLNQKEFIKTINNESFLKALRPYSKKKSNNHPLTKIFV